jgi:tetratricopeptide (TPR) repeat protein
MALNLQSAYDQALPLAQRAVALGHTSGGAEGEAMGAIVWGEVLTRRGQLQAARPVFERALRLGRNVDGGVLSEIEWRARIWLGIVAQLADDYAAARHHIGDALGLCRVRHALMGEMTCLHRLATLAVSIGDYTTGRDEGARALDLARALDYPWGEGVAQLRFGQALLGLGDDARAAASLDAALIIFRDIGDRTYEASTLTALGRFADSMGEYARARAQLEQALNICQALHAYEPAFDALVCLSLLWSHLDDHALALTYADQAAPIANGMGSRLRHAQVLIARSRALRGLHRAAEAEAAAQHARTLCTELGVRVPFTSQPDPN